LDNNENNNKNNIDYKLEEKSYFPRKKLVNEYKKYFQEYIEISGSEK
jgi:hypothetical protein